MKRKLLKTELKKPILFVIGLLVAVPFILGSGCSTDANHEGIEALVGTSWKLTSIEAIDDSVFQQYENGIWKVPNDQKYLIDFNEDDIFKYQVYVNYEGCNGCWGEYDTDDQDSLSISVECYLDVFCGTKDQELQQRLWATKTFEKDQSVLHLYYHRPGMEGILHFEKTETQE